MYSFPNLNLPNPTKDKKDIGIKKGLHLHGYTDVEKKERRKKHFLRTCQKLHMIVGFRT